MRIRPATAADLDVVCDFNARLAFESEGKTLDRSLLVPGVAALLADPTKGRYFVAEIEDRVVGQMALTFEWSDWRNGWFWWIQSVYVHPDHRRRGIFASLFRHLEEEARGEKDVIGIRLYVEAENDAAHATYEKLGLKRTTYSVREKYPLG
jgi:GNAT superfamily N-acetyltransferase